MKSNSSILHTILSKLMEIIKYLKISKKLQENYTKIFNNYLVNTIKIFGQFTLLNQEKLYYNTNIHN